MAYDSFDQVNVLSEIERRSLLQQGDPSERVWAAWSLGLEFGASLSPDLIQSLNQAPHPGTRRHLVIMLAGHGEKALMTTIAKHDPDEIVRATACQYIIQTAATKDADLENLLMEILTSDEHPSVHKVILDNASNGFPELTDRELVPLTKSSDIEVRRLAIDLLMAQMPIQDFVSLLDSHIFDEEDDDLRVLLEMAYIEAGETSQLLKMSIEAPETLRLEIMDKLIQAEIKFSWDEIGPLIDPQDPCIDCHLAQLLAAKEGSKAFHWLIRNISRMGKWPSPRNRAESDRFNYASACALFAEELLFRALPDITREQITDTDLNMLDMIIRDLENYRSIVGRPNRRGKLLPDWINLDNEYIGWGMDERLQLLDALKLFRKNATKN